MRILRDKCNRGVGGPKATVSTPRQRGIALIVVLGFMFVLAVLVGVFGDSMRVEAILARNADSDSVVEWLCRSGVEISKYILSQQMLNTQEPYDSLNQSWAGGPGSTNGLNPLLDSINLTNSAWGDGSVLGLLYPEEDPGEDVRCSIKIVDLERKFNINIAAGGGLGRFPLERTFEMIGVDESLKPYLVDAIIDWCDEDDAEGINGVESKYYEALGYTSKDGPIDDLTELLLIKDITPKMFWGNSTNQLAGTSMISAKVEGEDEEPDYPIGLVDLFTPISGIRMNINTASSDVLQLLPGMDQNRVQFIIEYRAGLDGIDGTWDDEPFTNIQELRNVPGFQTREAIANASRFLSVRSATFEVTVTAEMRGLQRTLVAVISRPSDPKDIKILYTYWK